MEYLKMDYIDMSYMRRASVYVEKFKDQGNGTYNMRCPLCGDSKKDKTKARGYLLDRGDHVTYFCHNCQSPNVKTLGKLIQFLSPSLYQEYRMEKFGERFRTRNNNINPEDYEDLATNLISDELKNDDRLTTMKRNSESLLRDCISLSLLDETHVARKYLLGRKLDNEDIDKLFYLDDINKLTSKIDKYKDKKFKKQDCILIPFIDFDGIINCIQLRMLAKNSPRRYLTLYLQEDRSKAIYGLNYIDKDKTVYACEGPFDSMFLDNAIAFAGSSQSNKIDFIKDKIKDFVIVYDPDYKINAHIRYAIEKSINLGYSVVLYDDKYFNSDDDINDVVKRLNWTKKELMDYIRSRTFKGLSAKLELAKYDKPQEQKTSSIKQKSALKERLERTIRR